MDQTLTKILSIFLVVLGECLSIYAEMLGAKTQMYWKVFLTITLGGAALVGGYMLGLAAFKNIWVITVASITSILIVEPFMGWIFFHQVPTIGPLIGFVLGMIGFVVSILF